MTCQKCGSACQGGLCRQCEVERQYEHLADEVASGDPWDRDDDTEGDDE
ncbi:hypothetical protein PM023_16175 [Halorubrum ezzemoulense]|nr:hypothetical protein [Halorubrum ezzemoulense]MDB2226184.1 hypothetical protein [Halorubrum ezzemoulense]